MIKHVGVYRVTDLGCGSCTLQPMLRCECTEVVSDHYLLLNYGILYKLPVSVKSDLVFYILWRSL